MNISITTKVVRNLALALVLLPVLAVSYVAARILNYTRKSDTGKADAAIVLGAAVAADIPTPVFEQRIIHAVDLYQRGTVDRIILTGGIGAGDSISEAEAARTYCLSRGVADSALLVETESHSTEENLRNAGVLAATHGIGRVLIVSDPLHERRAVTIARDLGLDAHASPTPTTRYTGIRSQAYFLARETYFFTRYLVSRAL